MTSGAVKASTWLGSATATSDADVTLPVVFHDRELRKHDPKDGEAFGVTLFAGRSQRILVSAPRARLVVAAHRGLADSGDAMTLDIAHGRLLGRVVAHEVGHALLLTLRHSTARAHEPAARTAQPWRRSARRSSRSRPRIANAWRRGSRTPRRPSCVPTRRGRRRVPVRQAAPAGDATITPITWVDAPPAPSRLRAPR